MWCRKPGTIWSKCIRVILAKLTAFHVTSSFMCHMHPKPIKISCPFNWWGIQLYESQLAGLVSGVWTMETKMKTFIYSKSWGYYKANRRLLPSSFSIYQRSTFRSRIAVLGDHFEVTVWVDVTLATLQMTIKPVKGYYMLGLCICIVHTSPLISCFQVHPRVKFEKWSTEKKKRAQLCLQMSG